MRTALVTNSSVGGASAVPNPSSQSTVASQTAVATGATQVVQAAAEERGKVLASERGAAPEARAEENFDNQASADDKAGTGLEAQRNQRDSESGLIAVA